MSHRFSNKEVVALLKEVLAAMEIKGANRFRIRAYQNAIASMDNLTQSVYDLWQNNRLDEIPGVGGGLSQHLTDLFEKGSVKEFDRVRKALPQGMFSLITLRGVGAKKAYKLAKAFDLDERKGALEKLKKIAESGQIRELEGFGEKSEKDILDAIKDVKISKSERKRLLLIQAERVAEEFMAYMLENELVKEIHPLGSLRRRSETVGDIDMSVSTEKSEEVLGYFVANPKIREVVSKGDRMSTVLYGDDMQIDLLTSDPDSYGSLLQHFTGSKQHNILLRTYALEKGLSLSQYGVKKGKELVKFANEKEFYKYLGLPWIPPELREGKDEIELALKGELPVLVELSDVKGDVHIHTTASSDGLSTLEEMVSTAWEIGHEYIGISDHNPSVASRGVGEVRKLVEKQAKAVRQIDKKYDDIKVLLGYEVSILADSTLAMPDDLLEKLDYVIASIHSSLDHPREKITKRLVAAIRHPLVNIIGHPSGRLLNERPACDIDWKVVLEEIKKHNKILEINAQPNRLDLPYDLVKEAKEMGIKFVVNTDAHEVEGLGLMKYGVDVARRGWCEKKDVVNTYSLEDFLGVLGKK